MDACFRGFVESGARRLGKRAVPLWTQESGRRPGGKARVLQAGFNVVLKSSIDDMTLSERLCSQFENARRQSLLRQ
jgi:hypothetical protein